MSTEQPKPASDGCRIIVQGEDLMVVTPTGAHHLLVEYNATLCALATISHNLKMAGALCLAFWLGQDHASTLEGVGNQPDYDSPWAPGCGRPAPADYARI